MTLLKTITWSGGGQHAILKAVYTATQQMWKLSTYLKQCYIIKEVENNNWIQVLKMKTPIGHKVFTYC